MHLSSVLSFVWLDLSSKLKLEGKMFETKQNTKFIYNHSPTTTTNHTLRKWIVLAKNTPLKTNKCLIPGFKDKFPRETKSYFIIVYLQY